MELDVRDWLRAALAFGPASIEKWNYIDISHPYESYNVVTSDPDLQNDRWIKAMKNVSDDEIDEILGVCDKNGIFILTPDDMYYPSRLRYLANPPAALYVMGDPFVLSDMPAVAVLGARNCREYSEYAAKRFSSELASAGVSVISGLARGVDTSAHIGALEAGGVTAAVLGSGILYDYPKGSLSLKKRIARHGAVVSEYPPTSEPIKHNFKLRNRLLIALSDCALIIEASAKSGCLNSATHAAEQGRELFVLPPADVFDEAFAGQCGLLRDGASPVFSSKDILNYLCDFCGGRR